MRLSTYMKYMAVAGIFVLTAGAAHPQEAQPLPEQEGTQANGNCASSAFDSAALRKELARMQERWRTDLAEMQERARQATREVATAMTEQGIRREEMANLAAQMQTERAGLEARARIASQQAQQLFTQAPGMLLSGEDSGWLGLEMTEVTPEKAKEFKVSPDRGVLVSEVLPDSPAAKAGLAANDVIVEYDGQQVEGTLQFRRLVRETPPGRSVSVTIIRAGAEKKLSVQVGNAGQNAYTELREIVPPKAFNFKFNMPELFAGMTPVLGIEAEGVTGQLGEYFHVPGDAGVLVREVSAGTPAAKAGLKAGDVITRVDGASVKTVDELREQLREKREQKSIPLTVIRQGSQITLNISLGPPAERQERIRSAAL